VDNVEFLQGYLEDIPLPDGSVDVVISNCVINLTADQHLVLAEAARVLRSGGRLAFSDVIARRGHGRGDQGCLLLDQSGCRLLAGRLNTQPLSSAEQAGAEVVHGKHCVSLQFVRVLVWMVEQELLHVGPGSLAVNIAKVGL
jgi:SAM-dependent methyltransferase